MEPIRIGLMGFGEIGRDFYRLCLKRPEIQITIISDIGNPEILHYLLRVDGEMRRADIRLENNYLITDHGKARMIQAAGPADVPWDVLGIDMVVDCTHKYTSRADLEKYLQAGAKQVILSTVPKDDIDRLVIVGVNEDEIQPTDRLISAGSATTNAAAIMLKILDGAFGVERAVLTSIHAYTSDQPLRDIVSSDFRRSRSAAKNIIPNYAPSPPWLEKLFPHLKGKIDGSALNVPVPVGSLLDLAAQLKQADVSVEEINAAVGAAAEKSPDLIQVVTDPIVSSDVVGNQHSVVYDSQATIRAGKYLAKTLTWYDNILAHASRLVDVVLAYHRLLNGKGEKS